MKQALIKLECRNVWKLFGADGARLIQKHGGAPSSDVIVQAGFVGAVRDVSIEIGSGEIFVIMGLSGSGKSTLVRLLSRLIEPTSGQVLFDEQDLTRADEQEMIEIRRHKMGMVFQQFALLPHRTVLGNVAFPLEVRAVSRKKREARAGEVIELVGLKGREANYPRELSGGQQQRVGIARSLTVEPELWFLDEPFSALDPLIRREMQDEFLRLQGVLHKTIVFITHDFEEAIRLADRIAIMKDGEVVQVGTPEQLVMRPATDYVRRFTRHVPRAKVLSVGAVMNGVMAPGDCAGVVRQSDLVADIAARIEASEKPFLVHDDDDWPIGSIGRRRVIDILVGRESV